MLKKFEVENFRGFKDRITFDFTAARYDFCTELVSNGIVKNALIYGPNGIGKSALGAAMYDIVFHLTDKRTLAPVQVLPYANLYNATSPALFSYTFDFNGQTIVYEYGKISPAELVWEKLSVDGELILSTDWTSGRLPEIKDGLVGSLNLEFTDNKLSVVKYISRNTPKDTVPCITSLVTFCEKMLWYRSLSNGNEFAGYQTAATRLTDMLCGSSTVKNFEAFLSDFGLRYKLGIETINNERILFAYFPGGQKAPFEAVASTGTMALYLFFCWSVTAFADVSLLYIDEFDAFLHYEASLALLDKLKEAPFQTILTTHNTSLLSHKVTRPDCSFLLSRTAKGQPILRSLANSTDREIRQIHNLEKLYRAGTFQGNG